MPDSKDDGRKLRDATRLVWAGRDKSLTGPFVNPPVIHASTVLFDSADAYVAKRSRYTYARRGNPTTEALETALTELEHAEGTVLCPSGLSACATALLSCLASGDQLLMADTIYAPTRRIARTFLARMGIETVFYDPLLGGAIAELFTERTRAVYLESPGTMTFEVQDLPAIAAAAQDHGAVTLFDNTWASPVNFKPLDHGADLVIEAGTKYVGGHSDVSIGTVSANAKSWPDLKEAHGTLGLHVAPDDVFLALRGLRTMAVRLQRHAKSALEVATWLSQRTDVEQVLYPPLEDDPGHAIWRRDMPGAGGLMSLVFDGWDADRINAFVDALELFGLGDSWGGYESLVSFGNPARHRTATKWRRGLVVRLFIGLEDPLDLIADIEQAFERSSPAT